MELGGDSLAAEELLSSVSEKLGVVLPSSVLVDASTLAEFAHRVGNAPRAAPSHPTVVPLCTGGTRPPLFCFAGAGGLGLGFVPLARRLGDDQPVYAFQAHGLEHRGIPDWTVERAARRHIQMIRVLRPHGPYALAGHSLGGLIAMEIAHQLAAAGEDVGLLVLLDTYLPTATKVGEVPTPQTSGPRSVMAAANGKAKSAPASASVSAPAPVSAPADLQAGSQIRAGRPSDATRDYAARLRQSIQTQLRTLLPQRFPRLTTLVKVAQLPLAGLVRYPGLVQFDVFFNHGRLLERFYRARLWPGRTLVYRAQDNPDDDDAWSELLQDYEVHDLACEHFSVLREPHIQHVSERVAAEIDKLVPAVGARLRT
jgi:thioesterase domain-containing protein